MERYRLKTPNSSLFEVFPLQVSPVVGAINIVDEWLTTQKFPNSTVGIHIIVDYGLEEDTCMQLINMETDSGFMYILRNEDLHISP